MERINFLTGGQPFRLDDFQRLYNLTKESVDKLGRILQYGSYKNVILEGCSLSKTVGSPNDTYVYSSGYTVIDGYGVVKFPTVTLTELTGAIPSHSLYLCSRNESGGTVIFKDLNTKDIWPIYEVIVKKTTGSPTGTLICTYPTLYTTEQGLFSSILPSVSGAVSVETSNRITSDNSLSSALSSNLSTAISSEASVRSGADQLLSNALTSGDSSVYAVLSSSISTEVGTRSSVDSSLTASLSTTISNAGTLKWKVFDIGDWDMNTTEEKVVFIPTSSLPDIRKIRSCQVMIRPDDSSEVCNDLCTSYTGYTSQGSFLITGVDSEISTTDNLVYLRRKTGGLFSGISYNDSGYNRGWITISYIT